MMQIEKAGPYSAAERPLVGPDIGEDAPSKRASKRIPGATYRLQFNRDFTFRQAVAMAEYLHDLGITDCYASPIFRAGRDSTHGYDICRFDEINPILGGAGEFDSFAKKLSELSMGLILDIVPNHMGIDSSNSWWMDVLLSGPNSEFASFFDIDWRPRHSNLRDQVLLPILGEPYATALENGEIKLLFENDRFLLAYHERRFPIKSCSDAAHLQDLCDGTQGARGPIDKLHALLQDQYYRLAYWRTGVEEINYRRFFDVTDLVSLRMERPEVFDACHRLVLRLIREGKVTGLRVDHPDGLWDPKAYLTRLREHSTLPLYLVVEKILSRDETVPRDWPIDGTTGYDFLNRVNGLFVHSANAESLARIYRDFSGCDTDFGSVAYQAKVRVLQGSFRSEVDQLTHRLKRISECSRVGWDFTFRQLRRALVQILASFRVYRTYATEGSDRLSPWERACVEQTVREARGKNPKTDDALFGFMERLLLLDPPVDLDKSAGVEAREFVLKFQQLSAPATAKGVEDTAFYNYFRLVSLNEVGGDPSEFGHSVRCFHAHNLSQSNHWPHSLLATATHDTKRGEDVRARINVLSEMPEEWRAAVWRWHDLNADKKRLVEDQAAPGPNDEYLIYQTLVGAWPVQANVEATSKEGVSQSEHFCERLVQYMVKAVREAKVHTSWMDPEPAYEAATTSFVRRILDRTQSGSFLDDFSTFQRKVAYFGRFNSLAQVLLKLTSPGVPDFYQGTELWDFSLVDPDNRRSVEYNVPRQLLKHLKQTWGTNRTPPRFFEELLGEDESGKSKLFVIWQALLFRNRHHQLFECGKYIPLEAEGPHAAHICAFARGFAHQEAIVVVPRLPFTLCQGIERPPLQREVWGETRLVLPFARAGEQYRNYFTGECHAVAPREEAPGLRIADLLVQWPVALLELT